MPGEPADPLAHILEVGGPGMRAALKPVTTDEPDLG